MKVSLEEVQRQAKLAEIEGLELNDVLNFFSKKATYADIAAINRVCTNVDLEVTETITSQSEDGKWVMAWVYVPNDSGNAYCDEP